MNERITPPATVAGVRRVELATGDGIGDRVHLLTAGEIHAVNAAIAAGRPLLVRGEPGVGKSQLARAAAKALGRAFVKHVVDSHTESRDLLWTFDAVKRLAEAQLAGALREDLATARAALSVERFLHPGPLWWAFDWADAERQSHLASGLPPSSPDGGDWRRGCVLLLDEIDKAEAELPNGLLEALGAREFTPPGRRTAVRATTALPLVVITTNEERVLPDAFLRRCLSIRLAIPEGEKDLIEFLIARGRAHFPDASGKVLREAATMLVADRQAAIRALARPYPGQAEYLDLVRAVVGLEPRARGQLRMLSIIRKYAVCKATDAVRA